MKLRRDEYRRRTPRGVWHMHRECPAYPPIDGSEVKRARPAGKLCRRCLAIETKPSPGYEPQ